MVRMFIKLNEKKIVEDNIYTLEDIELIISETMNKESINDKSEEGIWLGNGDKKDFARFITVNSNLEKNEWWEKYVEAWVLDVNGEIEDLMDEKYKKCSGDTYIEMMENTTVIENNCRMSIMYTLDAKKIEKLGANWHNIVLDIDEYLNSKGFEYSRTLGYVNDRVLERDELAEIVGEILTIGLGKKYFYKFDVMVIENEMDLTELFKKD